MGSVVEDAIVREFTRVFGEESVVYLMGGETKEVAVRKMQFASELVRELAHQGLSEPRILDWFTTESPRVHGKKPLEVLKEQPLDEGARKDLWEWAKAGVDYEM